MNLRVAAGMLLVVLALLCGACAGRRPPDTPPAPAPDPGRSQTGIASWYGKKFHGRRTASGERYDMHAMTAAHRTLPFGTRVEVTDLETGRSVRVRINDRGPFVQGRIIDLSYAAARKLGMVERGLARVRIRRDRLSP
jgi:rare lipoprotein A